MKETLEQPLEEPAAKTPRKGLVRQKRAFPDTETVRGNQFAAKPFKQDSEVHALLKDENGIFQKGKDGRFIANKELFLSQSELLARMSGCCRKTWNMALALMNERLSAKEKLPSYTDLCLMLTRWKSEYPYLNEVPHHPLQQTIKEL